MWKVEPRNLPYRDALKTAHLPGWPAPLSRAQSETIAKFVVIDMFAKACAGKSTKEVIADAKGQPKQIYNRRSDDGSRLRRRWSAGGPRSRSDAGWNAKRVQLADGGAAGAFLVVLIADPLFHGIWISLQNWPVASGHVHRSRELRCRPGTTRCSGRS